MPKPNENPTDPSGDEPIDADAYALPDELADGPGAEPDFTEIDPSEGEPGGAPRGRPAALRVAVVVGAILLVAAALLVYRSHHRRTVLDAGLRRADQLLRLDTAAGYREAASHLEPLARLDPLEAASVRAFALAMLYADYRDEAALAEAEALLVEPGRAEVVPRFANLAGAALALGRREAGNATNSAARAHGSVWADTLQARIALLAGNLAAAVEPAAAASADGAFAAGLAIQGDVLRRARRDASGARAAYTAALAASPMNPRATFGLAKLALAGKLPPIDATGPLQRLVDDRAGTPAPERARAALHLAALRLRLDDRPAADAALDGAALDPGAHAWAERAAASMAASRIAYRVVDGAPAALQSASDDDPYEPPPPPPVSDSVGPDPLDARPPPPPRAAAPARRPAAQPAKASSHRAPAAKPAPRVTAKKLAAKPAPKASVKKPAAAKATAKKPAAKATAKPKAPAPKKPAPKTLAR